MCTSAHRPPQDLWFVVRPSCSTRPGDSRMVNKNSPAAHTNHCCRRKQLRTTHSAGKRMLMKGVWVLGSATGQTNEQQPPPPRPACPDPANLFVVVHLVSRIHHSVHGCCSRVGESLAPPTDFYIIFNVAPYRSNDWSHGNYRANVRRLKMKSRSA